MRYIKVKFTSGQLDGVAFQEVDSYGSVRRYLDEKGDQINTKDEKGNELIYEAYVVQDDATPPFPPSVEESAVVEEVFEESMPQTVAELEAKIREVIDAKE